MTTAADGAERPAPRGTALGADAEELRLPGGNVGGAVRVRDTVRRPTGPWTPAVHALLRHLDGRIEGVPRVLGYDEHGREALSYLPGEVVDIDSAVTTTSRQTTNARRHPGRGRGGRPGHGEPHVSRRAWPVRGLAG